MRRTWHARRRRALALAACVLWLLGVEVLPALHVAHHDDDHAHVAGSIIRVVENDTHQHGGVSHSHGAAELEFVELSRPKLPTGELAFSDPDAGHEAAGLAHHATALLQPPLPVVEPLPVDPNAWWIVDEAHARSDIALAHRPVARGPPA